MIMQASNSLSKSLPAMITCECEQILNRMSVQDAYGKSVPCDNCQKQLKPSTIAYHCINGHCYCLKCSATLVLNTHNKGLVTPIHCACQEIMILTQPTHVYASSAAYCNNTTCRAPIGKLEYCYHCPKGKSSVHPKGYDYCMKCAKKRSIFGSINKSKKNITENTMQVIARPKIENQPLSAINNSNNNDITEPLLHSQQNSEQWKHLKEKVDVIGKDYSQLKNAILNNIKIRCDCKAILVMTKPYIVYSAGAECDLCREKIATFEFCFHCPKEKSEDHSLGFDVCLNCSIGNKLEFIKYEYSMKKQIKKLKHYEKFIKPEILTIFEQESAAIHKNVNKICGIMPVMIDTQNKVFEEIIKKLKLIDHDEQPGIDHENIDDENEQKIQGHKSDSDMYDENEPLLGVTSLSLKQLYVMRNVLNECLSKYENMSVNVNKLSECLNYKINDMECEWEGWNADDIVDWIIQLENGRFVIYENILRKELNDGDATGAILPHLDISDWRKSFSIKNWKDAVDLNKYKDVLVANKKEQAQHPYPSPFDPNEEGANANTQ